MQEELYKGMSLNEAADYFKSASTRCDVNTTTEQLAEWLAELQNYRQQIHDNSLLQRHQVDDVIDRLIRLDFTRRSYIFDGQEQLVDILEAYSIRTIIEMFDKYDAGHLIHLYDIVEDSKDSNILVTKIDETSKTWEGIIVDPNNRGDHVSYSLLDKDWRVIANASTQASEFFQSVEEEIMRCI